MGGNNWLNAVQTGIGDVVEVNPGIAGGVAPENPDAWLVSGAVTAKLEGRNNAGLRCCEVERPGLRQSSLLDIGGH